MTNFEKYKEEILKIANSGNDMSKVDDKLMTCREVICPNCDWRRPGTRCTAAMLQWLYEEYTEPQVDWSKVEVDTPILVRECKDDEWIKRHFAKFENGKVYAWTDGRTGWSAEDLERIYDTMLWKYAKLPEEVNDGAS